MRCAVEDDLARLTNFTNRHVSHHRPLALVTSGGTVADLEVRAVRFLDNFSTGQRGACAVELFLQRGYAVVHLKRSGSLSPFARVLQNLIVKDKAGAMDFDTLGQLFDWEQSSLHFRQDSSDTDELGRDDPRRGEHRTNSTDSWMYSSDYNSDPHHDGFQSAKRRDKELSLHQRLRQSPILQSAIQSYRNTVHQETLLTVTFRTVEEYLQKLKLCCEIVDTGKSLALVYLTAAVSDFFIPKEKRQVHKIQSQTYELETTNPSEASTAQLGSDQTLTLTLYPVPKVIPSLRNEWCPHAFVVSFKLETDSSILLQKSIISMQRNDVHLVIGNELSTRYEKVVVLSRAKNDDGVSQILEDTFSQNKIYPGCHAKKVPGGYCLMELTSGQGVPSHPMSYDKVEALEHLTIDYVIRHHFHYISTHTEGRHTHLSPVEEFATTVSRAEDQHLSRLQQSNRHYQREKLKIRMKEFFWNLVGSTAGLVLSYGIARMLHHRQQNV